jgi:hypothetical protein
LRPGDMPGRFVSFRKFSKMFLPFDGCSGKSSRPAIGAVKAGTGGAVRSGAQGNL